MKNHDDYRRFIGSIVKEVVSQFNGFDFSLEDLYQRAWLELLMADNRYDPRHGAKFTTYAYKSVKEGIRKEAIFQINRSGITEKEYVSPADAVSIDDEGAEHILSLLQTVDSHDQDETSSIRNNMQLLTKIEKKVLYQAYGIDCERISSAKKIAKLFGMSELMVKKSLESGKRKLKELSDGR